MALLPHSQAVKFYHLPQLLGAPRTHQDLAVQDGVETKTKRTAIVPQEPTMGGDDQSCLQMATER